MAEPQVPEVRTPAAPKQHEKYPWPEHPTLVGTRMKRLDGPVKVWTRLGVHRDDVGTRFGEGVEEGINGGDHQVDVERLCAVWSERLHHRGPDRQVRHEMPVHHVDMDPVRARLVDRTHFIAEMGEVC